ncbi:MAG: polyamine aminopropyltransferase, partial [Lysobacterales bacterium]
GIGSWLSRFFERQLPAHFLRIELMVALVGGALPAILFIANAYLPGAFRFLLYAMVLLVGTLVGLEIPLVMRILRRNVALKELVSQVLTFDYLGALAVSLAFPLVLVPQLGLIRTGLLFGLMNAAIALWALWLFRHELRHVKAHALACALTLGALGVGFAGAEHITTLAEDHFYQDRIVFTATTPYQRIVVTSGRAGHRLFLNGNLQFAERDEYRYHEALVHPALAAQGAPGKVLVLGGGDGLAVREVLKHPSVEQVVLVELDPHITRLFAAHPVRVALNAGALASPKLRIVNADAFTWLEQHARQIETGSGAPFDIVIADFPDPSNYALGKLYTTSFYQRAEQVLSAGGWIVVQTTSPLIARKSFWTVVTTLEAVGLATVPYHAHVPSFGEWGFVLAGRRPWPGVRALPSGLRFLTAEGMPALLQFPPDMARVPAEPNRLSNQVLVGIFEEEWGKVR